MATVEDLESRIEALRKRIETAEANIARWPDRVARGVVSQAVADENIAKNQADIQRFQADIDKLQAQLAEAQQKEKADAGTPTASAGQTVDNAQRSNDDRADPVAPYPAETQTNTAPTTANQFRPGEDEDTGTDAELRRIQDTNSTPPPTAEPVAPTTTGPGQPNQFLSGAQEDAAATPTSQPGAGAPGDDSGAGLNPVAAALKNIFGSEVEKVKPNPNILDKCASYTYNISIYLITPQQYAKLTTLKKKDVSGLSLVLQSGGAPPGTPGTKSSTYDPATQTFTIVGGIAEGRNPNFPFDYYIDDLQIKSVINGKGTMSAHSAVDMSFRIIEPNGITFIQNLAKATGDLLAAKNENYSYLSQIYLMVIRFYGYDQNGMPVIPQQEISALQSDKTAITEKFIPFTFTNLTFRIESKLTEYTCTAVTPQNMIGTGQQRGVIPYNFQLTSTTLKDLLTKDLADALNGYQKQQVDAKIFTYPDKYTFKLLPPLDLDTIKITPPGDTNLASTAMNARPTDDPKSLNGKTQSVKADTRTNSAHSGMAIVQFIDQMVRTSDYIYQQQIFIRNPKTQKLERQASAGNLMAWYRISVEAIPQPDKWDPLRGDYAYDVTYQVAPYLISDTLSEYFPRSPRWTPPKEYKYWFTGENTAILNYSQDFNNLYFLTVNTEQERRETSPLRKEAKKGYQPTSGQSSQGIKGKVNEGGANAADYLYSPSDLVTIKMTIIGDPDWIQQGDVWSGLSGEKFDPAIRLPDGTINYESRETLFDVVFMTPADYNLQTGLIGPGPVAQGEPSMDEFKSRYKAVWVTNNFSKGRFTQDIQGVIVLPNANDDQPTTTEAAERTPTAGAAGAGGSAGAGADTRSPTQIAADDQAIFDATGVRPINPDPGVDPRTPAQIAEDDARIAAAGGTVKPLTSAPPTSNGEDVGVPSPESETQTAVPANPQLGRSDP